MKKYCLLSLFILILLIVSCGQHSVTVNPDNTESPSSGTMVPAPTREAAPAPTPEPFVPVDFKTSVFEFNDDSQRLYIKTEFIDPFEFRQGTVERTLAESIHNEMDDYIDWIKEDALEYPATEDNLISYGLTSFLNITQNDISFTSIYVDYYTYEGGAHGNLTRAPYVYDRNGKRYESLESILSPGTTLSDVEEEINAQMKKMVEENGPMFYEDTVSFEKLYTQPYFYIKNNELVVFFQTYEIAPYAAGIPEFTMPSGFLRTKN